jgi:hypothetical protein
MRAEAPLRNMRAEAPKPRIPLTERPAQLHAEFEEERKASTES